MTEYFCSIKIYFQAKIARFFPIFSYTPCMLFDTHSHLSYAPLDQDEGGVFARLHDVWVGHTMQIGCDVVSSLSAITLAQKYPWHYASVGLHPVDAQSIHAKYEIGKNQELLKSLIEENHSYVRAIGETGLDNYHLPDTNIEEAQQAQETWFRLQIELAQEYHLPLVIQESEPMIFSQRLCRISITIFQRSLCIVIARTLALLEDYFLFFEIKFILLFEVFLPTDLAMRRFKRQQPKYQFPKYCLRLTHPFSHHI